ncbi:hypothetical protein PENTCL1PPCAC_7078, partial [Pristionchus entomophagus]
PSTTSFVTQPYLHFPSLKSNPDGRSSIHSLEKTHLSKNDVIRLVMDKDKPVFPVKAKFETGRPQGVVPSPLSSSTLLKRKRELIDERGVEEEVARNVSKILSATRAAQNAIPPSIMKSNLTTSNDHSWAITKAASASPKILSCDTCLKSFPSPKILRSHSCITSADTITSTTTINLSQILQIPPTSLEMNGYDSTELPSNLITPDVSSYESSPPSETASMDEWNGVALDGKMEDSVDRADHSSLSNPSKTMSENKWCPDCGKVLCSSSNLRRHRASCKQATEIKDEPSAPHDPLPKWAENKSQSWLQLSVGEHLKAKHLGLPLNLRNEVKDEKRWNGIVPYASSTVSHPPVTTKEEIINISSTILEKECKNGIDPRVPFECTVCYKTFSCRKNVRRHMMAIHKVAPPPGA